MKDRRAREHERLPSPPPPPAPLESRRRIAVHALPSGAPVLRSIKSPDEETEKEQGMKTVRRPVRGSAGTNTGRSRDVTAHRGQELGGGARLHARTTPTTTAHLLSKTRGRVRYRETGAERGSVSGIERCTWLLHAPTVAHRRQGRAVSPCQCRVSVPQEGRGGEEEEDRRKRGRKRRRKRGRKRKRRRGDNQNQSKIQ
ncbi:unnamed protein product [Pleuronectes platessa]|uniref:Uncharacterized protein n=1 Tax=Pleuronectes platessa TaxID=8262 RepID=A0A9N7TLI1_PLEPL|nr:unnamed protein product [Pleuronectes platessa]